MMLLLIVTAVLQGYVVFTSGQVTMEYEPLRCFQCTGPLSPLCDGDDQRQFGEVVNCPDYARGGTTDSSQLGNRRFRRQSPWNVLDIIWNLPIERDFWHKEFNNISDIVASQREGKTILHKYNHKYLEIKDGFMCWTMKVEYSAQGLIEMYKGCQLNMGTEFAISPVIGISYTPVPYGYCLIFTPSQLVGPARGYDYANVTVCFCAHHGCNKDTLPYYDKDDDFEEKVGLEDVNQRRLEKTDKKSASSVTHTMASTQGKVKVALSITFSLTFAVYLVRQ